LSRPQKMQMIEELSQKLSALKEQKSRLEDEVYDRAEKRDKLNEQVRNLRVEVQELRSERDELNEKVKKLKDQRNETTKRIREKIEEKKKLNQESNALANKKPPRSYQILKKEAESIDWKIQTTPLALNEEKELVERVKQLESQLNVYRKLQRLAHKTSEIQAEVRTLKAEGELNHQKLTEIARESQEIHRNMLQRIEESKKLKAEADRLHKQFLEARERARPVQEEIAGIINRIRQLKGEIQEQELSEKRQSQDALREALEKEAREKLKRGEKLSWEEFQLLGEKGMTTQD